MDNLYETDVFEKLPGKVMRPGGVRITNKIAEKCQFGEDTKILDAGCGTGISLEYLEKNYGVSGIGVDVSGLNIEKGKSRNPLLQLYEGDASSLNFGADIFDAVLMECSLSVMENKADVLREAYRVLKPEGKLVITDLYLKEGETNKGSHPCCSEWTSIIENTGFHIEAWEDETKELMNFMIEIIFEYGSIEAAGFAANKKTGYFSLVAIKPDSAEEVIA